MILREAVRYIFRCRTGDVAGEEVHIPVVPNGARVRRPFETHLDINILLIDIEQVIQDHITLGLVQANDTTRHRPVDEQGLPARGRVYPHQRVDSLNVLGSFFRMLSVQVWMSRDVDRLLPVDDLAEVRGQLLIGGVPTGPEGVTAHGRRGVDVQVRVARRLELVDQICVPARCSTWIPEIGCPLCGHEIGPDDGHPGQAGNLRDLRLEGGISDVDPEFRRNLGIRKLT